MMLKYIIFKHMFLRKQGSIYNTIFSKFSSVNTEENSKNLNNSIIYTIISKANKHLLPGTGCSGEIQSMLDQS